MVIAADWPAGVRGARQYRSDRRQLQREPAVLPATPAARTAFRHQRMNGSPSNFVRYRDHHPRSSSTPFMLVLHSHTMIRRIEAREIIIEDEVRERHRYRSLQPSTKCRHPIGRKRISPAFRRHSRICGSSAFRSRVGTDDPAVDAGENVILVVHERHVPGRRDLHSLAADDLSHEVIGQIVVKRRDGPRRPHPEKAAQTVRPVKIFGNLDDIVPQLGQHLLLLELLLAVR